MPDDRQPKHDQFLIIHSIIVEADRLWEEGHDR